MIKIAIITGASSGIGYEISKRLLAKGYEVFGFGRDFSKCDMSSDKFHQVELDIRETGKLSEEIKKIKKLGKISILVNNAGAAYYGLHEELNPQKISEMVRTNLEVPMILSNLLLRELKENNGYIFNISSVTATGVNPHGCAYGATKAGLTSFSKSLFEEQRKYGLKVINIQPDLTDTNLYRNADFGTDEAFDAHLIAEDIGDVVDNILEARDGVVVTDITVRPQLHRIKKKNMVLSK